MKLSSPLRSSFGAAACAAAALALGACGTTGDATGEPPAAEVDGAEEPGENAADHQSEGGADESGQWPRTVTIYGDELELESEPRRILSMSVETSDIALELAGPDRMAAIAPGSAEAGQGNASELGAQVEETLPAGVTPEPEQLLSWSPDLVLMTGRHDNELDAAEVLRSAGVPTVVFDSADFSDPAATADMVRIFGELLGAEEEARDRAEALEQQIAAVEESIADAQQGPRAMGLMARGPQLMAVGQGMTLSTLIEQAGGESVAAEMSWRGGVNLDPEVLIAADPEVIIIEDFRGAGRGPFEEILNSAAVSEVPAIAEGRVYTVSDLLVSGSAGLAIGDGLEEVARILHPEQF
ncbi:ABC transporter substrate-binding protein [Bogoriella caseilytica]|uniref:Iron complex transport system substrate-binding protein n=1 Tax=Bogoriella caseilytica TaxID=56055 RepID=A0A3N2BAH1_9MICO|nr:ABC transporter substrate-binding protein [Bogoriella caseilytica]ROR72270.1 iron complex transport system substrate-binding protein [Bogoriella caseilytica]